jgi:hypothetical protein
MRKVGEIGTFSDIIVMDLVHGDACNAGDSNARWIPALVIASIPGPPKLLAFSLF